MAWPDQIAAVREAVGLPEPMGSDLIVVSQAEAYRHIINTDWREQ